MIVVTTESTADIEPVQLSYSGVRLLPVPLGHQDQTYFERDLPPEQLVGLIRATGAPARTLAVPDDVVAQLFEDVLGQTGMTQIVHVASGSGFTPDYEVASRVAREFGGRVQVLDGGTVSYALGVQALHAAHLADQGAGAEAIAAALSELRQRTLLQFAVESLDFLRFNGRIGPVAALVGNWLDLRPLLAVEAGNIVNKARVRGESAMLRSLLSVTHKFQTACQEPLRLYSSYTVGGQEAAQDLQARLRANYPDSPTQLHQLGSGLTANVGSGMVAVLAFPRRFGLGHA